MMTTRNNTLIPLSFEEIEYLSALQGQAEIVAPRLHESLAIRFSKIINHRFDHPNLLAKAISYWFVNLFHYSERPNIPNSKTKSLVSIQLMVASLDLVLHFGHSVTSYSVNPQMATEAFNKSLTNRMLDQQREDNANLSHLYELCLLD